MTFTVVGLQPIDDRPRLTAILVEDDDREAPVATDDAMRRIAIAVQRGRSLAPAEMDDVGRYAGPIGVDSAGRPDRVR